MSRMMAADQVIVGTNRMRRDLGARHRRLLGVGQYPLPVAGDRLICLRNDRRSGFLNGSRWIAREVSASADQRVVDLRLAAEDDANPREVAVRSWTHHFLGKERELEDLGPARMSLQEFDFGYYITCHKAQGSQWDDVVLYDESGVFRDADTSRRWLYTGITRASRRLLVVA